jgi:hypothetical protein
VTIQNNAVCKDTLSADRNGDCYLDWTEGWAAPVKLFNDHGQSSTYFELPEKFLILSDLHGNVQGTIELLLSAGVMDDRFNWIYDGSLIINGDVFDRGDEVTECLWLLYQLWQYPAAADKIVLLLGNHENMTLSSRTHQVKGKYQQTCELLNLRYNQLYGEDTYLGKWLRHWQACVQIGEYGIMHAGISPGMAERFSSLSEINDLVRDYYQQADYNAENVEYVFGRNGIFWYRGYFYSDEKWERADSDIIAEIRAQFNLKTIIVGHTTMEDIAFEQNGQVIAIDAGLKYQESGKALLYENGRFFVLAANGIKKELKP